MPLPIEAADGPFVVVRGRRLTSFAGCDYLGLARHPEVVAAAREALAACGVGAAASRTTTGTWAAHVELERALADWNGEEDAVLLPSGYVAGAALAAALARDADVVLLDAGAHPSLVDAATLTGLPVVRFPRFDADAARRAARGRRPLVVTDSVDVATGRLAPLRALRAVVDRAKGRLVVDDAHGVGVLGARGRGAVEELSAEGPRVHVAGSLSKALGAHGGFVVGSRRLCDDVRSRFRAYAGATPIPPSTAAAATAAVRLASGENSPRRRLRANASILRRRFAAAGLATPRAGTPWFAVSGRAPRELKAVERALFEAGFLVPHIRYFGAPAEGFLKIAVTAAHRPEHVEALADALAAQLGRGSRRPRVPR
jgi:7-keto-8-aminopelargonate synthetase-like enzyme